MEGGQRVRGIGRQQRENQKGNNESKVGAKQQERVHAARRLSRVVL